MTFSFCMHSCSCTMDWWWPKLEVKTCCHIMRNNTSQLCVTENIITHLWNFSLWLQVQIESESVQQPIQPRPAVLSRSKVKIWQLTSICSQDHEFLESYLLSTFIINVELLKTGTNFPSQYMYFKIIFDWQEFRLPPRCSWGLGCWQHIGW